MDSSTTTVTIGGRGLTRPPISTVTATPTPTTTLESSLSYIPYNRKPELPILDVSFSSYLKPPPKQEAEEDTEISIFEARKYFDDGNKLNSRVSPLQRMSFDNHVDVEDGFSDRRRSDSSYRARSFHTTPTASSEASWNSQTGLLSNPPGTKPVFISSHGSVVPDVVEKRKGFAKWGFRRKCPCSGKKSVEVKEIKETEAKSSSLSQHSSRQSLGPRPHLRISADSGVGFSFPRLNQSSTNINTRVVVLDDPPRGSIEVFQPSNGLSSIRKKSQRQIAAGLTFSGSPRWRLPPTDDDEAASDASSDLFEIESFSTQTTTSCLQNLTRDSLEEIETETDCCYEPSEASIDWSVTTAEASVANFSGFEFQTDHSFMNSRQEINRNGLSGGGGGKSRGGGGLLSCRSDKAVMVSAGPYPIKNMGPVAACVVRDDGENSRVGAGHAKADKPPLPRSRMFAT